MLCHKRRTRACIERLNWLKCSLAVCSPHHTCSLSFISSSGQLNNWACRPASQQVLWLVHNCLCVWLQWTMTRRIGWCVWLCLCLFKGRRWTGQNRSECTRVDAMRISVSCAHFLSPSLTPSLSLSALVCSACKTKTAESSLWEVFKFFSHC